MSRKLPASTSDPEVLYYYRDGHKLLMQGLAAIVRVAQSADHKHALAAGEWLAAYGERLIAEKAAAKAQPVKAYAANRDQIIAELRGLYAKALGEAPLVVEVEAESEAVAQDQTKSRD